MNGRSTYLRCLAALALTAFVPETFGESVKLYADLKKEDDGWYFVNVNQENGLVDLRYPLKIRNDLFIEGCSQLFFGAVETNCLKDQRIMDLGGSEITLSDAAMAPVFWTATLFGPVVTLVTLDPLGLVTPIALPLGMIPSTPVLDEDAFKSAVKEAQQHASKHMPTEDALALLSLLDDQSKSEFNLIASTSDSLSVRINEIKSAVRDEIRLSTLNQFSVKTEQSLTHNDRREFNAADTLTRVVQISLRTDAQEPNCEEPKSPIAPFQGKSNSDLASDNWEGFTKILTKRKQDMNTALMAYEAELKAFTQARQAENERCELALENYQHALESSSKHATLVWPNRIPEWIDTPYTLRVTPESWTIDGMQSTVKPTLTVTFQAPDS